MAGQVYTAPSNTTETARELQHKTAPGAILGSREIYELLGVEFSGEPFHPHGSSSADAPAAYLIDHMNVPRSGVPLRRGRPLSRFVGRARELAVLQDRLAQLAADEGHVVSVSGEPGIGKSRLVDEFQHSSGSRAEFLRTNCLSYAGATPYLPVLGLLRQICDLRHSDGAEQIRSKLNTALANAAIASEAAFALLSQLLEVPVQSRAAEQLSPGERRMQTFECLHRLVA